MDYKKFKQILALDDKRGLSTGKITALIGALVFIVIMVALAPTMFTGLNATGGPSFMTTVLPVMVGAGIVMMVWKLFR